MSVKAAKYRLSVLIYPVIQSDFNICKLKYQVEFRIYGSFIWTPDVTKRILSSNCPIPSN